MKTRLILVLFVLSSSFYYSFGQSSQQDTFRRSIGVDATFINNFLPLEFNIGSPDAYLFHYIKHKENNKFIKQAFDINLFGSLNRGDDVNKRNNLSVGLDYKIGKGKRRRVFKKGSILFGLEGGVSYMYRRTTVERDNFQNEKYKNTYIIQAISPFIGPFLGFEYRITKRLSVFTESGIYLSGGYEVEDVKSQLNTVEDVKEENFSFRTLYRLPRSIILFYYF